MNHRRGKDIGKAQYSRYLIMQCQHYAHENFKLKNKGCFCEKNHLCVKFKMLDQICQDQDVCSRCNPHNRFFSRQTGDFQVTNWTIHSECLYAIRRFGSVHLLWYDTLHCSLTIFCEFHIIARGMMWNEWYRQDAITSSGLKKRMPGYILRIIMKMDSEENKAPSTDSTASGIKHIAFLQDKCWCTDWWYNWFCLPSITVSATLPFGRTKQVRFNPFLINCGVTWIPGWDFDEELYIKLNLFRERTRHPH